MPGAVEKGWLLSQAQAQKASVNKFYRQNEKHWLSKEWTDWACIKRASAVQIPLSGIHSPQLWPKLSFLAPISYYSPTCVSWTIDDVLMKSFPSRSSILPCVTRYLVQNPSFWVQGIPAQNFTMLQ